MNLIITNTKTLILTFSVLTAFISTVGDVKVLAVPGVDSLKAKITEYFLKTANNPKSQIYQQLQQFNQENTDGRNRQGVLPKTIKSSDIQVIPISGEDAYGRYCSEIANQPGYFQCDSSVSETYLILIPYKQSVHKAVGYDSLKFTIKAKKVFAWIIDQNENQSNKRESISIEEPTTVNF